MAIDTTSLSQLITDFRALKAKDSITPESLGYILQTLTEMLGDCSTDTELANLNKIVEKVNAALTKDYMDIFNKLGDYDELIDELQNTIEGLEIESAGQVPIYAEVYDDVVYIRGHETLLEQGYKPFLFRFAKRQNRNRHRKNSAGVPIRSPRRKGWLLMGRHNVVSVSKKGLVTFAYVPHKDFHIIDPMTANIPYHTEAGKLMDAHTASKGDVVSWGKTTVNRRSDSDWYRMLRFQFAIGFAKTEDLDLNKQTLFPSNLVSTLATFTVIQNGSGHWTFSR